LTIIAAVFLCITIMLTPLLFNYSGLGLSSSLATAQRGVDLTGVWRGNDGALYYLRQIGNTLWWNGLSTGSNVPDGRVFDNVFKGTITSTTNTIVGDWADVPRGTIMGYGKLSLNIVNPTRIQKVSQTGSHFGATIWTKPLPPNQDPDGDSLPNSWEQTGVDVNNDGRIDLNLP